MIDWIVSLASLLVSIVAIIISIQQTRLSNKQQLFDRRLTCYIEFNTIYTLYIENKLYLESDDTFCSINDLIFSWLTNCTDLEEMTLAVLNPLHNEEQKVFLSKYEHLRNFSIEISMVFDDKIATILKEFIFSFAELLKTMYQQQVYITNIKKQEERDGMPNKLDDYQKGCKDMAKNLGIFQIRDRLANLNEEIVQKQIIDQMKKSVRLPRLKK